MSEDKMMMMYTASTDSMSGPFYATFKENTLILAWAVETVRNDFIFENVKYAGNDIYYVGKETLVLLEYDASKDFSDYHIMANKRIAT